MFCVFFLFATYLNICRSLNGVYYLCFMPPLYDGILKDPRDLDPCPHCCHAAIKDSNNLHSTSETITSIQPGGYFKPNNCTARERLVIVVPYRDREQHLKTFLRYMHQFLQAQQLEYVIYVVEPALPTKFNRGILVNVGIQIAMKSAAKFTCYVIHDVDLLPTDDQNLYVCSDSPRHMSSANSKFNYTLPYFEYAGGVISFTPGQFKAINGFSNVFFGWGGEDDNLRHRIALAGYELHRVPLDLGRYKALDHGEDKSNPVNPDRYKLMKHAANHMTSDGLNSLRYKLLVLEKRQLYTWVYVALNESDYAILPSSSSCSSMFYTLYLHAVAIVTVMISMKS